MNTLITFVGFSILIAYAFHHIDKYLRKVIKEVIDERDAAQKKEREEELSKEWLRRIKAQPTQPKSRPKPQPNPNPPPKLEWAQPPPQPPQKPAYERPQAYSWD